MLRDLSTRQIVNVTSLPSAVDNAGCLIRYNNTLMYSDGAEWGFIWHSGEDGKGSGLDADFVRGINPDTQYAMALANKTISDGGNIRVTTAGAVSWSQRFTVIAIGRGSHFSTNGYFDIALPPDGTLISGVNGASDVTVSNGAIQLIGWQMLYYALPIGGNSASLPANFKISNYNSTTADAMPIPANWLPIVLRNNNNATYYFATGILLKAGDYSYAGCLTLSQLPDLFATTAGTAPNYTATTNTIIYALTTGLRVTLKVHAAASAAVKVNLCNLGAKALKKVSSGSIVAVTSLPAGAIFDIVYNGTDWVIPNAGI